MKSKIKKRFHKALSIVCASLIGILTVVYSFSMPVYAVHTGGGGSLFGGTEGDTMTGADLKSLVADYNSQYVSMPTPSQYIWSYQSTESTSDSYPYILNRSAPLYMDTYGLWGKMNRAGVYILPFFTDDYYSFNNFYSDIFYHFYSSSDSSGNQTLYADVYNLSTGSLVQSSCKSTDFWNPTYSPYLGFDAPDTASTFLVRSFSSYENYMANTSPTGLMSSFNGGLSGCTFLASDYSSSSLSLQSLRQSSTFTPHTNGNDDWGFILSSTPFELFSNQTSIDFSQVPDNYVITISGDTIYDYSITNPDTGDTSTINYYITNNYTLPENSTDYPGDNGGSSSGGSTSGNVNVSGEVVVGGQIDIKSDPIDINVNVNMGSSEGDNSSAGSSEGVQFDEDVSLNNYYDWMNEQTSGFSGFMKEFFNWLPADILIMICAGFGLVILARFLGR